MPVLNLFTNLPRRRVPRDFVTNIIPVLSNSVQKPAPVFVVSIAPDCLQNIEGDEETPSVIGYLGSIGHMTPAYTKRIARDITDYIEKTLGVPDNRVFLTFADLKPHEVAKSGNTIG